jgi:hypothetical protein
MGGGYCTALLEQRERGGRDMESISRDVWGKGVRHDGASSGAGLAETDSDVLSRGAQHPTTNTHPSSLRFGSPARFQAETVQSSDVRISQRKGKAIPAMCVGERWGEWRERGEGVVGTGTHTLGRRHGERRVIRC